jgi:hypothetical protein
MCPCADCDKETVAFPQGVILDLHKQLWQLDEQRERIDRERALLLDRFHRLTLSTPTGKSSHG